MSIGIRVEVEQRRTYFDAPPTNLCAAGVFMQIGIILAMHSTIHVITIGENRS